MRLKITNASKAPDEFLLPLIQFAAKFFSVAGRVTVAFRETKTPRLLVRTKDPNANPRHEWGPGVEWKADTARQKLYSGYCHYRAKVISVCSTLNEQHPQLPIKADVLGYFAASQIPITPHELRTPAEIIVHVAAHEFGHLMKRGQKFRKSRIEVFCENKATEVLEAYRTAEGQAWIAAARARMTGASPADKIEAVDIPDDGNAAKIAAAQAKLDNCRARLKRWQSKEKRAKNAIRKLARQIARLERKVQP